MEETILLSLSQIGYEEGYFISSLGNVFQKQSQGLITEIKNKRYRLKKDGKIVYRSIKTLYREAFGKEYAKDNILSLPNEQWKPIDEESGYYISSLGRVKSYKGVEARLLKPYTN